MRISLRNKALAIICNDFLVIIIKDLLIIFIGFIILIIGVLIGIAYLTIFNLLGYIQI